MKKEMKKFIYIIATLLCCTYGYSTPPPTPQPGIAPPPMLPIDDGLYLLLIISLLIAGYKLIKYKKRVLR